MTGIAAVVKIKNEILRTTIIGALVGAIIALAIYGEYRHEISAGISPRGAGLGTGILALITSLPFGFAILYGLVTPILHLIHYQQSRTINMVLILLFGVVGNWTLIGALIGTALARSASRLARARGSAPNAGDT